MSNEYDQLLVLEGPEAVRYRPVNFVGDVANPSLPARLLAQALCHAVDEAVGGRAVSVSLAGTTSRRACIAYDAGMPLEIDPQTRSYVALVFLTLHAGCSNRKKHIDVGSTFCELGLAVMNACCSHVRLEVVHNRKRASFEFSQGTLLSQEGPVASSDPDSTRMGFELDPTILGDNTMFDCERVNAELLRRSSEIPNLRIAHSRW